MGMLVFSGPGTAPACPLPLDLPETSWRGSTQEQGHQQLRPSELKVRALVSLEEGGTMDYFWSFSMGTAFSWPPPFYCLILL